MLNYKVLFLRANILQKTVGKHLSSSWDYNFCMGMEKLSHGWSFCLHEAGLKGLGGHFELFLHFFFQPSILKELSIITISFHHPTHFSTHCNLVFSLSPSTGTPQAKVVSGFMLSDLPDISYSLSYLTSVLFDTVAQFLLCKTLFPLVPMTLFSLLFLCLFYCSSLSPLYGLEFPAFCVWHLSFFTLHSFLGQTGGPEMGFPDPGLLLLVPNGHLLLLMTHRYYKLNYVYNQTSHPHLSFLLISSSPFFLL